MAALTLAEAAKVMTDPLTKGVAMMLLRQSDIIGRVPFKKVGGLTVKQVRALTLPSAGFRKVNAGYTPGGGQTEQVEWAVKGLGGDVDIDKVYTHITDWIEDPHVTQLKMKAQAVASEFNYYFMKGSPTVDADGFYGLEYLCDQLDSRQKIVVGSAGTPFDPTASTANTNKYIDMMCELNELVGGATCYFCNFSQKVGAGAVLRRSGMLDTTKDQFDRTVFTFQGASIVDVGLKRDQSTEIITDTEDPGDGGEDTTSMYAVRFGEDELCGIKLNELDTYWVGGEDHELESKPVRRARIDWWVGLATKGKWSIARAYNIEPKSSWT